MAVGLLDLPNELLLHIGQTSSDGVLYRLILTNRHLAELLNPILWSFPVGRNVHANLEPTDLPFACESKIDGPMELLSYAVATDNALMARKLFDHDGLDYDDDPDTLHSTLRSAVEMGRRQWVDMLLATVEEQHRTVDHDAVVSMIRAAMDRNDLGIAERLLRHRAIQRRCWDSVCKHAMRMRNEKLLGIALDRGKTDPPVGQTELNNLFCFAATMGHIPSLEVLHSRGAEISYSSQVVPDQVRGPSALHVAASRNHTGAVAWMLDHGADINVKDEYGRSVGDAASGQLPTLKLLINRGADVHQFIRSLAATRSMSTISLILD